MDYYTKYKGFTPGPWVAGGVNVFGGTGARTTIANTTCAGSLTRDTDEKNATLIADAPILLEKCRQLESLLCSSKDYVDSVYQEACESARTGELANGAGELLDAIASAIDH